MNIQPKLLRTETELNFDGEIQNIICHFQEYLCDDSGKILSRPDGSLYQLEGYRTVILSLSDPLLKDIVTMQKQIETAFLQKFSSSEKQ
jgi:hypothetical protein